MQHLHEMVIKSAYPTQGEDPVFGQNLTQRRIDRRSSAKSGRVPARFVAQKQVMSCTTPALIGEDVQPRRFVVRSYLSAYGDSYTVMNGGADAHHAIERYAGVSLCKREAAARTRGFCRTRP